jgi:Holliday junction DNA helicase RuvA
VQAIASENLAVLTKIPGVGKKTAERLLLELKSQVKSLGAVPSSSTPASRAIGGMHSELVSALINLGYKQVIAEPLAEKVVKEHPQASFETLVREALQRLR